MPSFLYLRQVAGGSEMHKNRRMVLCNATIFELLRKKVSIFAAVNCLYK